MRAVWSYWTKPVRVAGRRAWPTERSHALSWVLSVETARKHYPEVVLVTDTEGAHLLVDELGIAFDEVSTELDALRDVDPDWWAMGKLYAYRAQKRPFMHVDNDVFLWKRLPAIVEHAPVLAQSPEALVEGAFFYEPERLHEVFRRDGGQIPSAWTWYLRRGCQTAACCGILGGNDVGLLRDYADTAIGVALDSQNSAIWAKEGDLRRHMMFIEQYLLCACVEHRRAQHPGPDGPYVQYLFPSAQFDRAVEVGYTHLIAEAKRNSKVLARIERVVQRDYPKHYQRCVTYAERIERNHL